MNCKETASNTIGWLTWITYLHDCECFLEGSNILRATPVGSVIRRSEFQFQIVYPEENESLWSGKCNESALTGILFCPSCT